MGERSACATSTSSSTASIVHDQRRQVVVPRVEADTPLLQGQEGQGSCDRRHKGGLLQGVGEGRDATAARDRQGTVLHARGGREDQGGGRRLRAVGLRGGRLPAYIG